MPESDEFAGRVDFSLVNTPHEVTMMDTRGWQFPVKGPLRLTVQKRDTRLVIYSAPILGDKPFTVPVYPADCYPLWVEITRQETEFSPREQMQARHAQETAWWWASQMFTQRAAAEAEDDTPTFQPKPRALCNCPSCDYCRAGSCFDCGEADMVGETRTRKVEFHEIVVPIGTQGAHYTDVGKAITLAVEAAARSGGGDVFVRSEDDEKLIIGYAREEIKK